jgi:hypothetical protein
MKSTDEQNDAYRRGIDGPQLKRGSTELAPRWATSTPGWQPPGASAVAEPGARR